MATCYRCRQSHFGLLDLKAGLCKPCREATVAEEGAARLRQASVENRDEINKVILTTEGYHNLAVTGRIGIVSAECAFGMNVFKDLFAGVRDAVGGRSEAVQKTMRDSRQVVLDELKCNAYELGADAVVAIQFSYVELSTAGSMVLLVATGTAVTLA